jgi:metal-dependent amidase/aminoacylase/carboxypeptidase family protein
MHPLVDEARGQLHAAVELRRAIHREPELGLDLPLTQAKVLAALEGLPLEIRKGRRTTSLGTRPEGYADADVPNAHSNRYLLNEQAMINGMAMYAGVALAYLSHG